MLKKIAIPVLFILSSIGSESIESSELLLGGCKLDITDRFRAHEKSETIFLEKFETGVGVIYVRNINKRPLDLFSNDERFDLINFDKKNEISMFQYKFNVSNNDPVKVSLLVLDDKYIEFQFIDFEFVSDLFNNCEHLE